eukprot:Phypoly_transcript_10562.p1 GENE.Phypoly_transcript_10562~~Phypoly_transcript_10562.p1  ORF type:complete len:418 (+),score=65.52 Phypoly_transcript_10562:189-1256(+)
MATKEAAMVLYYHSNSVTQALLDLFPNIGLVKSMFPVRQNFWYNIENRRKFFEDFAREGGFDPLVPDHWYANAPKILEKNPAIVLSYHNNSVAQALLDLFPNIGLVKTNFHSTRGFWNVENRRHFFENYAQSNGFDFNIAENWYLQPQERIMEQKGAETVLEYHRNSLASALMDLFPSIGLDKSKFLPSHVFWRLPSNRRNFFVNFAKDNRFNPGNPDNWYAQSRQKIMETKGAQMVLYYHNNSISKALMDLFPNIGLTKSNFQVRQKFWSKPENRRSFFENYAKSHNFDISVARNWYLEPAQNILSAKGAYRILYYHGNSISKALVELFPEMEFERKKFISNKPAQRIPIVIQE